MSGLRNTLQAIYDERGDLTPPLVVEAAADPESPLHARFDWDDKVAGPRWRLEQAAALIRSVRIVYAEDTQGRPKDLRAFTAVKGQDAHTATYMPTADALADDFTRQLVLRDMEREWKAFKRRWEHMREFAALIASDMNGETA